MKRHFLAGLGAGIILGVVIMTLTRPASLIAQPTTPEYKTTIGCYIHGVANPGNLQGGVQGMLNDNAKEGWTPIGVSVYPVQGPFTNAACSLVILRKP